MENGAILIRQLNMIVPIYWDATAIGVAFLAAQVAKIVPTQRLCTNYDDIP
jgi:hypothetical protein